MVSSLSGFRAAGFSSSAVPSIWKIDFFSGFGGSVSGSAGALANTTGGRASGTVSASGCAAGAATCGAGFSGADCFTGCGSGFAMPAIPLSISFSCCIFCCSSSSCGSSFSGAFLALGAFWGAAVFCRSGSGWGAGFSVCTTGAGVGSAWAAAGCSGIAAAGASVRSSSAISSWSGCTGFASAPSRISPVGISSTGDAPAAGSSSLL